MNFINFKKGIIFAEFDSFWFINEPNVMQFERLTKVFREMIRDKLINDPHAIIRENFLGKMNKVNQVNSNICF